VFRRTKLLRNPCRGRKFGGVALAVGTLNAWQAKPASRASASVTAESIPPDTSTTARF
jgi:hypothetical protein